MSRSKLIGRLAPLFFIIQGLTLFAGNRAGEMNRDTTWANINGAFRLNMMYTY